VTRRHQTRGHLFRRLIWLAAAVAVPLQALLAYNVWQTAQREERQALQSVENLAAMIAHDAGSFVDSTTQYLTIVAQRPSLQAMDPARCDPVLEDAVRRHLHFANVLVTDLVGQSICSSVRGPGQVSRYSAAMNGSGTRFAAAARSSASLSMHPSPRKPSSPSASLSRTTFNASARCPSWSTWPRCSASGIA